MDGLQSAPWRVLALGSAPARCSDWRRKLMSGISSDVPYLITGNIPKEQTLMISEWIGMEQKHAIAAFTSCSTRNSVLWRSLSLLSLVLLIPTYSSPVLLQHHSFQNTKGWVFVLFSSENLLPQRFQLSLGHQHNRLLYLYPKLLTSKISTPHLWQFQG